MPIRTFTIQYLLKAWKVCYEEPKVLCYGAYVITRYMKCFLKETGHSLQKTLSVQRCGTQVICSTDGRLKWKILWTWSMGLTQVHSASCFSEQRIDVKNNCKTTHDVAISAISNRIEIFNVFTTIHSFFSQHEWPVNNSVYEFLHWHLDQLQSMNCIKDSCMTISSDRSLSYYLFSQEQFWPY